ncbi:MAG TPA: hypothetical protein EYG88_01900 [Desulfocapsa sulfexigens]|nr:hypothetical protein [Desulfocapsa sulfexigens]
MSKGKKVATGSSGPGYLEVICIALIVAAGAITGYDKFLSQKIKVVDLKGYVRTQKALLNAGEINGKQLIENLDAVEQVLDNEAAGNPNQIIILKDVVLRNGEEIRIKE